MRGRKKDVLLLKIRGKEGCWIELSTSLSIYDNRCFFACNEEKIKDSFSLYFIFELHVIIWKKYILNF
ncbi:hypothetical protein BK721_19410 [Bacillus thuringiensis serovar nigeriensis]|uniref:Uncharacterized protein n=1 Tax=Bacillus thuringiensis serovar subtoxicus TaxID=475791 RepID=A0A9X6FP26_BACTU|nr:hypothetical protein CJ306_16285 [Bacillus cereus]OTX18414.1 hypothetical protein BK721_19410 [Bacillus thuringiensis serovar nigeriensis]OTY96265.1 hypothetical protein BK754_10560 [Bacillus thuringiensis serovar subtoxicus]TKV48095.1 hypothetical protein C1I58_09165 [Bacillus sp. PIC28]MBR9671943.1 hypothetical protein [Bacillus cereus]